MRGSSLRAVRSIPDVCEVTLFGPARSGATPELVLEVAHGATRARDFDALRAVLEGPYPADLREFYFVNTDVGAPEVALHVAERIAAAAPQRALAVVRCLMPRTFLDVNRVIDVDTAPSTSKPGEMTPGLHAWVRSPADRRLLFERYRAYRTLVEGLVDGCCAAGGRAVMVHSYAPRSIDVPVDEHIVVNLRAAYAPERIESWPLRAPVDLIVDSPSGERLSDPALVERVRAAFVAAGFAVELNGAYSLHPITLAGLLAARHRGRVLCLELRRDLLVPEFTPFRELHVDARKIERIAAPLAAALGA